LIDWHIHSKLNALYTHRLDLKTAQTAQEALDMVAEALKNPKYDQFELVGVNMRNGVWPDTDKMCRVNLDKLSTIRPIYLFWNGYHSICSNSIGLERVDHKAEGNGIIVEQEAFDATAKLSAVEESVLDDWIIEEAKVASYV
jgi:predicted amidohydrolase YtcJ